MWPPGPREEGTPPRLPCWEGQAPMGVFGGAPALVPGSLVSSKMCPWGPTDGVFSAGMDMPTLPLGEARAPLMRLCQPRAASNDV